MIRFTLPPGRIVQGYPSNRQDKDMHGKPKDKPSWFMAVAIPKQDCGPSMNAIYNTAQQFFSQHPAIIQRMALGLAGGFAFKVEDGDAPDNIGKEGFAGCYIYKLSTSLGAIRCCDRNNVAMDPDLIKRGYYVDVAVSCEGNKQFDNTAGVYLNPDMVRFLAYGPEISSGPTAAELFGSAVPPVPVGGSLTPFAAPGGGAPGGNVFGAIQQQGFPAAAPVAPAGAAPVPQGFPAGAVGAQWPAGTVSPGNPGYPQTFPRQ